MKKRCTKTPWIVTVWLLVLPSVATRVAAQSPAQPPSDPRAVEIADRVIEALGGRAAWQATRHLSWNFFGSRRHVWDRWSGDLRIEHEDRIVLMNIGSREGRVQVAGEELTDPEALAQALETAYAWWINDSYWMFMPFKLEDPGVVLRDGGVIELPDGRRADRLILTFEGVGLTPRNRFDVDVARDTHLPAQWSYYVDRDDPEPRFTLPWSGWRRFGGILLATDHGRGADWEIGVYAELPASVYADFAPVTLPAMAPR